MTRPINLVMVSLDGLRAADLADARATLPTLRGLAARGAWVRGVTPIFPSVTYPCHATIVTGARPATHGLLGNLAFDRRRGRPLEYLGDRATARLRVETLWDRLAARGEPAAAICWPNTRGLAALGDNIPEFLEQALFDEGASRPLWQELREAGLPVERYGAWSASHPLTPFQDALTLDVGRHVLRRRPPRLLLLHFLALDAFQHDHGVGSPEARWALEYMDTLVRRLIETLDALGRLAETALMVFGDHGFVDIHTTYHPNLILREEGLLEVDRAGTIVRRQAWVAANAGAAFVYVLNGAPRHTREGLAERFGALKGVEVVPPARFAELGLPTADVDPTQGDLVLVADEGYQFTGHATPEAAQAWTPYRGSHGHAPTLPGLAAGLVMAGPGVREGAGLGSVSMLDLAPTAARLLGIDLPHAEGRPLTEALA